MVFEGPKHRLIVVTFGICLGFVATYFVYDWFLDESYIAFESWATKFEWSSPPPRPLTRPGVIWLRSSNNSTNDNESIEPTQEDFPDAFGAHEVFRLDSDTIWSEIPDDEPFALYRRENRDSTLNCTECYGCQHDLLPVTTQTKMLNATFTMEIGGTAAWVFRVEEGPMVEKAGTAIAYVKVWCLPLMKLLDSPFQQCSTKQALLFARTLLGLDQLVEDCGFDAVVTRAWKGKVDGVVPGTGLIVDWDGIWFDAADGVSLSKHMGGGAGMRIRPLEVLEKLNSTEVILAALFELLTGQADRHSQNVFIDENAKITLIDNEKSFLESGEISSLFLPTTHKNAIVHVGNAYIEKKENRRKKPSIEAMLDYRCYAPGGIIGKDYPAKLRQCMEAISTTSPRALVKKYHLSSPRVAKMLKQKAEDMLHRGFEWTLENSNKDQKLRFPWYPKCCQFDKSGNCLDDWNIENYLEK
ncbi:hypothetical protein BSKO_09119 [Bryopsis sp. KO-2023]|nr:hypothetical protein BSKO_09119 [Bryopsis sp. KO-2023]